MHLQGAAAMVVVNIVPGKLHVIGVAGEIVSMLLFAGSHRPYIRGLVAEEFHQAHFIGFKASGLTVSGWALEVVAHDAPVIGVGWVHRLFAQVKEQFGYSHIVGRNADVRNTNAIRDTGASERGL